LIVLREGVPESFFDGDLLEAFNESFLSEEDTIESLLEQFKPFLLEEK
jgi:hypothetical protein